MVKTRSTSPPLSVPLLKKTDRHNTTHLTSTDMAVVNVVIVIILVFVLVALIYNICFHKPDFTIESVSVSLSNVSSQSSSSKLINKAAADWKIDFSIDSWITRSIGLAYMQFNVSVPCMTKEPTVTIVPGFYADGSDDGLYPEKRKLNANILTMLPYFNMSDAELEFDVNFKTYVHVLNNLIYLRNGLIDSTCKGLKIALNSNGTYGIMIGKPQKCPASKYQRQRS